MIFKHVLAIFMKPRHFGPHHPQKEKIYFNIFRGCFYLDFFSRKISECKNKRESFVYIDKSYLNANFP